MAKVVLKKGLHKRVRSGHPWVYRTEIDRMEEGINPGDIVEVYDSSMNFIGKGYINHRSMITVRMLTYNKDEEIDYEFFYKRIKQAWEYRKRIMDVESCRVVFAEADFLPALIVDKFGDYLVVQTLALGIDKYKDMIVEILNETIKPAGIYERNDVKVRELEGLDQRKGYLKGNFDTVFTFKENGLLFYVDVENGQKTGYFLDQKENRAAIRPYVKDAKVLDCFCHTGSFTVHAAHYGAREIIAVDISKEALDLAQKNLSINNLDIKCKFVEANAFDCLRELHDNKEVFDVIILDPPAFTKSRESIEGAVRGYKEINLRAMKILKPGGFLITCSCSQHMYPELFKEVILDAAKDAKKRVRLIEYRTQSKDHPILLQSEETYYLKCFILQIF